MSIIKTSEKTTSYVLIIISITLFFLGFYLREISNGAAHTDFELHIWPLINDFNRNYFYTLRNYLNYSEATFPFYHTIQSLFNPFKYNYIYFSLLNSIFNLLILYVFFYFLKKKISFDKIGSSIYILPFIFLLSPWFRSTSYWSTTENFALFFLIPACYYLLLLIKNEDNFRSNFLLTLFIALAIYSRQQFLFLALTHTTIIFLSKNYIKLFNTCIYYLIFSLPGLYTYYLWDVFSNINNATSASEYISLKNIFINVPKISTLIFFYSIPIILLNFRTLIKYINFNKFLIYFIIIIIIEFILFKNINYSQSGGGFIIKFNQIFFKNTIYLIIIISSLFFATIIEIRKLINSKYFILLFFIFLIIGLPKYLYQEWFDPVYLIFYYMLLSKEKLVTLNLDKKNSIYFLYFWEISILSIAILYYHFFLKFPFFYNF
tara:strand:- start:2681 stop:3979 length:1299 start_codon:yes stop_codon:yes gene_type:complete